MTKHKPRMIPTRRDEVRDAGQIEVEVLRKVLCGDRGRGQQRAEHHHHFRPAEPRPGEQAADRLVVGDERQQVEDDRTRQIACAEDLVSMEDGHVPSDRDSDHGHRAEQQCADGEDRRLRRGWFFAQVLWLEGPIKGSHWSPAWGASWSCPSTQSMPNLARRMDS